MVSEANKSLINVNLAEFSVLKNLKETISVKCRVKFIIQNCVMSKLEYTIITRSVIIFEGSPVLIGR